MFFRYLYRSIYGMVDTKLLIYAGIAILVLLIVYYFSKGSGSNVRDWNIIENVKRFIEKQKAIFMRLQPQYDDCNEY
jgi:hypothetical protein